MRTLNQWVTRRASGKSLSHAHISKQRKLALWMTIFSAVRTVLWLLAMLLIIIHWIGFDGSIVGWTVKLSSTVIFVTFISFYCNASTDAANLSASIAALFSADSHQSVEKTRTELGIDVQSVELDIARLADLEPGLEATALAAEIRQKIGAN